jgi:hypothetical protein
MTGPDLLVAESFITHQLDLLRLGAYTQQQALTLLDELGRQLEQLLKAPNLTVFNRARLQRLLAQATRVIDEYYGKITVETSATLQGIARAQGVATVSALQPVVRTGLIVTLASSLPPQSYLKSLLSRVLIEGARSATWWRRQSNDMKLRFASAVRSGLMANETNQQIVNRVVGTPGTPGVMKVSKAQARTLIHASIQAVANDARLETFKNMPDVVKGVRQLSTLDSRTTPICIAYSGQEWDLSGKPMGRTRLPFNGGPPRHWNCRSVLVPITKTFRELGINMPEVGRIAPRYASADGPTDLTMRGWLKTRTRQQLDEQLGRGRAALFRRGEITLQDLVDMKGRPLTLKQLERRVANG